MAMFNHFKSVISSNLKVLRRDVKRYEKALQIVQNQRFSIDGVVFNSKEASFSAKVKSQNSEKFYYTTILVKDNNIRCYCDCKDCEKNKRFCKHSFALAIVLKQFKLKDFTKINGRWYANINNNEMFISYHETIFDLENKFTLSILSDFADRIQHLISEDDWEEFNYHYTNTIEQLQNKTSFETSYR